MPVGAFVGIFAGEDRTGFILFPVGIMNREKSAKNQPGRELAKIPLMVQHPLDYCDDTLWYVTLGVGDNCPRVPRIRSIDQG